MLVPGDLGFRVAAVFIFVVFPVFGFVLRRKWRLELARREEINRLLELAAEEAARAELEVLIGYGRQHGHDYDHGYRYCAKPVVEPQPAVLSQRVCAVCFTPTANRCSQCKLVNYCSGKCQINHWRQGHKDECRPLLFDSEIGDEANIDVGNALKEPYFDDHVTHIQNDVPPCNEQGESALGVEGHGRFSNVASSSLPVFFQNDNVADLFGVEPDSNSVVRNSSVSFSDPTSIPGYGACIDDSTSDDDILHDLISESCDSSSTFDSFETASSSSHMEQTKPLEEKSYTRVDLNASISTPCGPKSDAVSERTSLSGLRVSHSVKNSVEPSIDTSGFWDGTLDTSRPRKYVPSNNVKPKLVGGGNGELPDLKSTVQLSSKLSVGLSSDKNVQVSETAGNGSGAVRTAKLVSETTISNKESAPDVRRQSSVSSPLLSSNEIDTRVKGVDENQIKSGEIGAASKTWKNISSPSSSSRANHLKKNNQATQKSLLSDSSSPSLNGYSSRGAKSVKAVSNATAHPQVDRSVPIASVGLKSSVQKVLEQLRAPRSSKQGDGFGRSGEKAVFEYDLFVKLYHWNKMELRPCGLINCGNSCYANAVLQCLAFTPPLTAYLLQGLHSKACAKKEWCFTCEFERLVLKANEVGYPQSPIGILSQIQKIGGHLINGREEDAHEFLRYAIETMQSTCLQEAGVKACSSLEEETTLIGLTFGGYLRSKIRCTRCHGKSERQERMMDLTVEIEGNIETLEDALRQFTGTESLDGENKYHCGRCKSFEKAKKKLNILKAPNVLTIALKRFQSGKFGKLNKSIRFPEILNLAPYMRGGSDKAPVYRLYGVVVHLDIMNASFSGHYVCYVRNAQNKWFKIDDSTVKPVELDRVLNQGAYMLFYSRCSPRAPRSIRSNIVSRDLPTKIKNPVLDPSRSNGRISASRQRETAYSNPIPDVLRSSHIYQDETRLQPQKNNYESESSSTIFTNPDDVSTSTDNTRDSISADDISDYIFGYNAFSRSSDLDTSSSSSSSSSSPLYMNHWNLENDQTCRAEEPGPVGGVTFLPSNSSKQVRNLVRVNISSSREANPLENGKSGVYLRLSRKKAD